MNEPFTDHCNDCGKKIEIDMETFLYTANCNCKSDIKEAIYQSRLGKIERDEEHINFKRRLDNMFRPMPKLLGIF